MTGTATTIWIMCAVIVVSMVIWLGAVRLAANHPGHKNRRVPRLSGLVQGGQHVGGGRSVAPRRDAPVPEEGGTPPEPEQQVEGAASHRAGRRSGNPMDL